jgi:hypothetical protein
MNLFKKKNSIIKYCLIFRPLPTDNECHEFDAGDRYRFAVVVRELRDAPTVEYKTALVAFINCIIISTPQLKDRLRIRNEFVGLKLLATLNELKNEAASDTDLAVQIDVFDEQRESDESQLQGTYTLHPFRNFFSDSFFTSYMYVLKLANRLANMPLVIAV